MNLLNTEVRLKGYSIGIAPINVKYIKLFIQIKKNILLIILFFRLLVFILMVLSKGRKAKIKIALKSATTPPSLLGIVRKIA